MATIQEAKAQITQAKQDIQTQRAKVSQSEQQLQQAKSKLKNIQSQSELRQRGGIAGREERKRIATQQKEIEKQMSNVQTYKRELSQYEKDVIAQEQKVKEAEKQQSLSALRQRQLETAYKSYTNQISGGALKGIPEDIKAQARKLADQTEQSRVTQQLAWESEIKKIDTSKGFYNPETFKYTSPQGIQMTLAPQFVPPKTNVTTIIEPEITYQEIKPTKKTPILEQSKVIIPPQFKATSIIDYKGDKLGDIKITTKQGTFIRTEGYEGTSYITPLTPTQQKQFEISDAKSKAIVSAPLIFLEGGYQWQKDIEKKIGVKETSTTPQNIIKYEKSSSYSDLYFKGNLPSVVRKSFLDVGSGTVVTGEKIVNKQIPEPYRENIKTQVGFIAMGSFFAPAFSTGATSKKATTKKTKQKVELAKGRFDELSKNLDKSDDVGLLFKKEGSTLRTTTRGEKIDYLRKIFKEAKNLPKDQRLALQQRLEQTFGKKEFRSLVKDFAEQEGYMFTPSSQTKTMMDFSISKSPKPRTTETPLTFDLLLSGVPQMKGSGTIVGDLSGIGRVGSDDMSKQFSSSKFDVLETEINVVSPRQSLKSSQIIIPRQKQLPKVEQKLAQQQKQEPRQEVRFRLRQLLKFRQAQASALAQSSKQSQAQKTSQKLSQKFKSKTTTRPKTKLTLRTRPIFYFEGSAKTPTQPKRESSYKAIGIRFGKEVRLGSGTKEQAEAKLSKFLTKTLGASGFLTSGGKKVESSLLGKKGFRRSKRDSFKVVEVKSQRLKRGTSEVPEIQMFKKGRGKIKNILGI